MISTDALYDAIAEAVTSAWGDMPIFLGTPRTAVSAKQFAVIRAQAIQCSFEGTLVLRQNNVFDIEGTFLVSGDDIEKRKIALVNAIVPLLQPGPEFAGAALPYVSEVRFADDWLAGDGAFTVGLTFSCVTLVNHH